MTEGSVLLVRHGETDWNRAGRLQGWGATPLNGRGREQAQRLGRHLATEYDVDRIVSSDSERTRETTGQIRDAGIDAEPVFDPAWRERGLGVYQGFTREELNERFPAFDRGSGALALEEKPEGGETIAGVCERVMRAWTDLEGSVDGDTILVVTHGGPIRAVLASITGLDILTAIEEYDVRNCGLTEIAVPEREIRRENERVFEPVAPRNQN